MSIIRLSGGLGNQLFQYSFAEMVEAVSGEESQYDLVEYKFPATKHIHRLEILHLIESKSINLPKSFYNIIPSKISGKINKQNRSKILSGSIYHHQIIRESEQIYDQSLKLEPGRYYVGNFISHLYWTDRIAQNIKMVRDKLETLSNAKIVTQGNSIGIHIRRGDYIYNAKTREFHGFCNDAYYINAVRRAIALYPKITKVSLASDSPETLKDIKEKIEEIGLQVDYVTEKNPILALLSLAGNEVFIGSNSTFSWWAAAITTKKLNLFPEDWFVSGNFGYSPQTYFPFPVTTISNALKI